MQLTYRYRLKDKHAKRLNAQARAINYVWNYVNETQQKAARDGRKWLTGYDLVKLVAGCTKEGLDLHSHSAIRVCLEYDKSRKQARTRKGRKKAWLKWRSKHSLGWVPFNTGHVQLRDGAFIFRGERYEVWLHRDLPEGKIGAGSFSQDRRGRWYINCPVEVAEATEAPLKYVGIDLGLKDLAALSTGKKIEVPRFYRQSEAKLANAQRRRKTKRVKAIHAKIASRRKDFLHKESAKLAKEYGLIVVGNVSPSKLAQTNMAKSVLDAGWSSFKDMLSWKLRLPSGGMLLEVNERDTTQACSDCGAIGGPKGLKGLGIREWVCEECGSVHDRDVNSAKLILRIGLDTLAGGTHG